VARLSLRQLRIFSAVAKTGNLAAAGRELLLSQATISEALKNLEGILGITLFDRATRRLLLTPVGHTFLKDAQHLLAQSESIYLRHSGRSSLICGASVTVGNYILPPIIIELTRQNPTLNVNLLIHNTEDIALKIVQRQVQVAVVEGTVSHHEIETIAWHDDELAVFASPGHPLAAGADDTTLSKAEWVLREIGSGTRETFDAVAERWPNPPNVVVTAGGNEFIKQMVASGRGVGCLSRAAIQAEVDQGKLAVVPISGPPMVRMLTVIRRRDAAEDGAVGLLLAALDARAPKAAQH